MIKVDGRMERGNLTRERILDAAISLIARGGVGAATQRCVADRAGVSLACTTYHFPTAQELVVAAMRRAAGMATARLAETQEAIIAGLVSLEDATVDYIESKRSGEFAAGVVALELSIAAVRDPALRSSGEANIEALRALFERLVAVEGQERAAAYAFTGHLLLELGSNRVPASEETRASVRELIGIFGLDQGVRRERASTKTATTRPLPLRPAIPVRPNIR
jgi:AcrR family transcriptional regulator